MGREGALPASPASLRTTLPLILQLALTSSTLFILFPSCSSSSPAYTSVLFFSPHLPQTWASLSPPWGSLACPALGGLAASLSGAGWSLLGAVTPSQLCSHAPSGHLLSLRISKSAPLHGACISTCSSHYTHGPLEGFFLKDPLRTVHNLPSFICMKNLY